MANDLSIGGLISGLDTTSLINRMMAAEQRTVDAYAAKKLAREDKANALKDVRSRLASLLSTISSLTLTSTLNVKKVSTDTPSTSSPIVSASANSLAANGAFRIKVEKLATSTGVSSGANIGQTWIDENVALESAGFALKPSTGKFTVNGKTVEIDSDDKIADVVDKINAAGAGVTASLVRDGSARVTGIKLDSLDTIRLGSATDTSNFLTAARLLTVVPAASMQSAADMGGVQTSAKLDDAKLTTSINAGAGSFKINNVEIKYDTTIDSLNNVINRINASGANVTAAFDATAGKLTLTSKQTGGSAIAMEDVGGGNFLAATGLLAAVQSYGQNAEYRINGGALQTSSTNSVSDAVPGVTIQFLKADLGTDVNVTVSQDTASTVKAIKDFVDQYNSVIGFISDKTSYDPLTKKAEILLGDSTVMGLKGVIQGLVSGAAEGVTGAYRTLADIGISTGAIGSSVGNTKSLVLNEGKLTSALTANPDAVTELLGGFANSASLNGGGTGSIASITGSPSSNHLAGTYKVVSDGAGSLTVSFTPQNGVEQAPVKGLIFADGTNSTLIPGITLTAKGGLVAGTDYITVSVQTKGVAVGINDYLSGLTSSSGVFASRKKSSDREIDDMAKRIAKMQDQLKDKEDALVKKFSALEQAMAKYQSQSAALSSQLAQLG